jgi:hypothetical protein
MCRSPPEQALAVVALLNDLADAIWHHYEAELLPLIDPALNTDTEAWEVGGERI